jgi:hypothetical protein
MKRAAHKKIGAKRLVQKDWIEVEDLFGANSYRQYNQLDTPEAAAGKSFQEPRRSF